MSRLRLRRWNQSVKASAGRLRALPVGQFGRHTCLGCRQHPARFRFRGEVRADRDHNLCFRCYRAEVNRQRARLMAA
jgi:hypothetical protein